MKLAGNYCISSKTPSDGEFQIENIIADKNIEK